jgi:hypothetical protein
LRNRIKVAPAAALVAALLLAPGRPAGAYAPSVADLDATARAAGNRIDVAQRIGRTIFATQWPAEVSQISANEVDGHLIVGVRVWGVKFHRPLTRAEFVAEIVALAQSVFGAEPMTEEVDFWASVPIDVTQGEVVNGDLAKPTSRTVFSLTVRRTETPQALRERTLQDSDGVFWDEDWVREALRPVT